MSGTRVLYTDIDGTLVGPGGALLRASDGTPSFAAVEALEHARDAGLEVVGVSGRAQLRMHELARLLGFRSWIAELGGVRVEDGGGAVTVERGDYRGDRPLITALRAAVTLLTDQGESLEEHDPWNEGRVASVMARGEVDVDAATTLLAERGYGWASVVDNGVLPRVVPTLSHLERVRIYHVVPRGVSKRAGIEAHRRARGLRPEDCAMVGDALSDLDCAAVVGRCFVVRNGIDKDPMLEHAIADVPDAAVTVRGHGGGFADAVDALLGG